MNEQVTKFQISDSTTDIVIFAHGFGVRWDSRGMFTDIQNSLPSEWGSVLFDFYDIFGTEVHITTIKQQVSRLESVIASTKSTCPDATIHIIAHSKGCIITALARPTVTGKVILLSPPETFGTKIENYFRRYPHAETINNELVIPRKDGTTTYIPLDFFEQARNIQAEEAILEFSKIHSVNLLQTTNDEVLGETTYIKLQNQTSITIAQVAADHNFTAEDRARLLQYVKENLQ